MSKHTPGPWKAELNGDGHATTGLVLADDPYGVVATVSRRWQDCETQTADASLIAAAPDLLEALKAVLTETSAPATHIAFRQLREQVLAAIAKAQGDTE